MNKTTKILPTDAKERKLYPVYGGVLKYFPRAIAAIAHNSWKGNEQHHPGTPIHWDRSKSSDDKDALARHILEEDWVAVAWRALAVLEKELEKPDHGVNQFIQEGWADPMTYVQHTNDEHLIERERMLDCNGNTVMMDPDERDD